MRLMCIMIIAVLLGAAEMDEARADMVGDDIIMKYSKDHDDVGPVTIGDGIEFFTKNPGAPLRFDFSEGVLRVTTTNPNPQRWGNMANVSFHGFDDIITDIVLIGHSGFNPPNLGILLNTTFTDTSISLNTSHGDAEGGAWAEFHITQASVPEPSLGLLIGTSLIGLVGVGAVRKIKQKKAVANI